MYNSLSPMVESILQLLAWSWRDINFQYDGLTSGEKERLSLEDHQKIVELMTERGMTNPRSGR